MYDIPLPNDKITYASLDLSFVVDENLNNYKEIHDCNTSILRYFLVIILSFKIYKHEIVIDFTQLEVHRTQKATNVPQPLNEGTIYIQTQH